MNELDTSNTKLRYEHVASRGKSRAINHGVDLCTGQFLALTDDDVIVTTNWLETFEAITNREPETVAFCGRVLAEPGSSSEDYLNLVLDNREHWVNQRTDPIRPGVCGANLFVDRAVFKEVGMYNINFGPGSVFRSSDDGELSYRLTRAGHRILYAPELFVYHSAWRGDVDNAELTETYAFSIGAFVGYYLKQGHLRPLAYFAETLFMKCGQIALGALRLKRERMSDGWLYLKGHLRGIFAGILRGA
jgi:GT2 family glycosyltransferase